MASNRLTFRAILTITLGLAAATGGAQAPRAHSVTSAEGVVTRTADKPVPDPRRHVPDELLVRLKPNLSPEAERQALDGVPLISQRRLAIVENLYHVKLAAGTSLSEALQALGRSDDVLYAEANFVVEAFGTPNDPSFSSQWALQNTGQTPGTPGADIGAVSAWDITTGSRQVVVAVIDSGVDYTHQDLSENVFTNAGDCNADGIDDDGNGYADDCHGIDVVNDDPDPMDDNRHGTHVAGTIGAAGNNALGVTGVNWAVTILPCKFLDGAGYGSIADAIICLDYVAAMKDRGVNVVATNNSWGGGLFSQALQEAIRAHQQRGILFVAAAGNSGFDNDSLLTYPCAYYLPGVLCVAATTPYDDRAFFSNHGRRTVHIGAPGAGILSTTPGQSYTSLDGTSMAAPHVSGVAALLHAQVPGRDWREVKNRILAGGETRASLNGTISRKRLSARGALSCNNSPLAARLRPIQDQVLTGIAGVELAALNINCGLAAGNVALSVSPGGGTVTLRDDGLGRDHVGGDGIYTALWTPPTAGTFSLAYPDGSVVQVTADPQLEPGFPVQAFSGPGYYQGGPSVHTLVGDIDGDAMLEILTTALAYGPLYAWKADGTPVPGWPVLDLPGTVYPALGELDTASLGSELVDGHYESWISPNLAARRGSGLLLPGWPKLVNFVASPASLADVDGDGIDEIFTEQEDGQIHAYRADGASLVGWPPVEPVTGGQERHTSAIADLDGDGDLEIVTASGSTSGATFGGIYLFAYHHDGSRVSGFPVAVRGGYANTFPVIGDVDGDGQLEIVVATRVPGSPFPTDGALVLSANGAVERTLATTGNTSVGSAPALVDLDGDGFPEIVLQTASAVNVWKGNGAALPGWPVTLGTYVPPPNGAPVAGDLDGDQQPDVVVLARDAEGGKVMALRNDGTPLAGFPKHLDRLGSGAVPAIADIDRDGRNELIVTSDYWDGVPGYYDKVWVYDLGGPTRHGRAEWGQFMSAASHHGRYDPIETPVPSEISIGDATVTEGNTGTASADFTVTLSPAPDHTVTVTWATADWTATAGSDYIAGSGSVAFGAGETSKTISVLVNGDTAFESDETFFVNLTRAIGGVVSNAHAVASITNDDVGLAALTCPSSPVPPNASYTTTVNGGSAARDWMAQYTPLSPNSPWVGTYKYVPLPRPATVTMTAPGAAGDYELRLFADDGYTLIGSCTFRVATVSALSINDVTVTESNSGTTSATFTVTLSSTATAAVTVSWSTADGTAKAPSDYTPVGPTLLTFNPGDRTKTLTVAVKRDTTPEPDENFFVNLANPSGAAIADGQGQGTIVNDDGALPPVTCPTATVLPGATFATTVSGGSSARDWMASYPAGAPNTPVPPYQYVPLPRPAERTVTAPSATGSYELRLFADDGYALIGACTYQVAAGPALSINDVTVAEGDTGTTNAAFTVTLSPTSTGTVTVSWSTADGTATAPSDYASVPPTPLTFSPGESTKTVTVIVSGDTAPEPSETFVVNLAGASGATLQDGQGQGTIVNDDGTLAPLTCPATVPPNASYTAMVNAGSSPTDWMAQYTPGSPNSPWVGMWKYVPLPRPASVTMTAPPTAGNYELRLFASDGYTVIGSCTFQVAGVIPALTCPAGLVPPNGSYTAAVNAGSSSQDWVAQYAIGSPDNPWIGQYRYVPLPRPANVPMTAPGMAGTYEVRLFANDAYSRIGSCTFQVGP